MPNTRQLVVDPYLKILVWSPSGAGKTTLLGTFNFLGKGYVFDCDGRIQVLGGKDIDYDYYVDIDPRNPVGYAQMKDKLDWIVAETKRTGVCPYKFIGLDSFTLFQFMAMYLSMKLTAPVMKPVRVKDGKYIELPAQADYIGYHYLCGEFLSSLKSLPCHLMVTAHEVVDQDEMTNKKFYNMDAFGKTQGRLPGHFNEVWRMDHQISAAQGIKKEEFFVITRPNNIQTARTSYPYILAEREPADMKHILTKITEHLKGKFPQEYNQAVVDSVAKG